MEFIPKDIEEIIMNYVHQLKHYDNFKHVIKDIKYNIEVEYLVPYYEIEEGYIMKSVKYNNEYFKKISGVICCCCGRDVMSTVDEYIYSQEDETLEYLYNIKEDIIKDMIEKNYYIIKNYNEESYANALREIIKIIGDYFEMLLDIDENYVIDLTLSEIEEIFEESTENEIFHYDIIEE